LLPSCSAPVLPATMPGHSSPPVCQLAAQRTCRVAAATPTTRWASHLNP
jgi:hypothetical protein